MFHWVELNDIDAEVRRILRAHPLNHLKSVALVEHALVMAEDRRYFSHCGIDVISILRAIWTLVRYRRLSGASTIEQQLVRTVRGRYEITLQRKISEMLLAIVVARRFSKRECLWAYLMVAYFGWDASGLNRAMRRLGFDIHDLSERQAATIAAMLKCPMPKVITPNYEQRLEQRVEYILKLLNGSLQ